MLYELVSENVTNAGGPMGRNNTWDNWRKHFDDLEKAKNYAQRDYNKYRPNEKIVWERTDIGFRSPDLSFVMYHISEIKNREMRACLR